MENEYPNDYFRRYRFCLVWFYLFNQFPGGSGKIQRTRRNASVGLSIGRKVFRALNKTELGFLIVLAAAFFFKPNTRQAEYIFPLMLLLILLLQSIWLLPALGKRVDLILSGIKPPPSKLHWYYISGELLKMVSLFMYGLLQWKS